MRVGFFVFKHSSLLFTVVRVFFDTIIKFIIIVIIIILLTDLDNREMGSDSDQAIIQILISLTASVTAVYRKFSFLISTIYIGSQCANKLDLSNRTLFPCLHSLI